MKKFLKILAVAAIAVAAAIACVFAGCTNGGGETTSDYNFTIVYVGGDKDGQAVNGQTDGNEGSKVAMQICIPDQNCFPLGDHGIYLGANGKLSLSQAQVNQILQSDTDVTVFVLHVIGVAGYKHDCEVTTTNGKGDYTLNVIVG